MTDVVIEGSFPALLWDNEQERKRTTLHLRLFRSSLDFSRKKKKKGVIGTVPLLLSSVQELEDEDEDEFSFEVC